MVDFWFMVLIVCFLISAVLNFIVYSMASHFEERYHNEIKLNIEYIDKKQELEKTCKTLQDNLSILQGKYDQLVQRQEHIRDIVAD